MSNEADYAKSGQPIKNGTAVVTCNKTGNYSVDNIAVINTPTLDTFQTKWNNRFHNGILVEVINTNLIGT